MKKYLVILILMFPLISSAQTDSPSVDLQALIKQLQTQIQSLQSQIGDLQVQVQSVRMELNLNRALAQGATGDDVKQLQEFLKTFTGVYPDGSVTGYFGPLTEAAVKKFQKQNGIEPVGTVGKKTREKLNVLAAAIPAVPAVPSPGEGVSATPAIPATPTVPGKPVTSYPETEGPTLTIPRVVSTTPSTPCKTPTGVQTEYSPTKIKVLSPNGGEQWQMGGTYTIKYSAENVAGNKALLIYLEKGHDEPTTKTTPNSSQLIGVTTNPESYTYKLNQSLPAGNNYKITVYVEGSYSSCDAISYIGDSSDETFSVIEGQYKDQPGMQTVPLRASAVPVSGGGYGQADKLAITEQITALQNQLSGTTDSAMRASLIAKITALKAQMQPSLSIKLDPQDKAPMLYALSAQLSDITKQFNSTTDAAIRASLMAKFIAVGEQITALNASMAPTAQSQINAILEQISAIQNKINGTTDAETRASLMAQIAALKTQVEKLSSLAPTPTTAPAPATPVITQAQTPALSKELTDLQNQFNSTTDTATRNYLMTKIDAIKEQTQILQNTPLTTQSSGPSVSATTQTQQAVSGIHEPSIVVISPNGGESLIAGKAYDIKWTGGNNAVDVYLLDNVTRLGKKIFSGIANNKYVSWIAKSLVASDLYDAVSGTYATPSGQYVMFVGCTDNSCTVDNSDSYFKIGE